MQGPKDQTGNPISLNMPDQWFRIPLAISEFDWKDELGEM